MIDLIRGIKIPPALTGFARGFIEAIVLGAIAGAIATWTTADLAALGLGETWTILLAMLGLQGLRALEGLGDQIDSTRRRAG